MIRKFSETKEGGGDEEIYGRYIYREKGRGGKIDIERKKGANRNIRRR